MHRAKFILEDSMQDKISHPLPAPSWADLQSEPYRLLFPLGFLLACVGIGAWIPSYISPATFRYPGEGHAVLQIQGFLLCFILGFLTTILPKVLGVRPLGRLQLLLFPAGFLAISLCAWVNAPHSRAGVQVVHLLLILNFLSFIMRRWPERKGSPPSTFAFIPLAFAADTVGTLLRILVIMHVTDISMLRGASLLQFQAFPLLLILGIGGFLLPKLFGNALVDPQALRNQKGSPLFVPLAMGSLLLASYALEAGAPALGSGSSVLRSAYLLRTLIWAWFTLRQLRLAGISRKLPAYLAAARLSLFSMGLGMAMPIFFPTYLLAWEHLIFISGFLWLTLSIAARVMTAHSGRMEILENHLWKFLAYGILILLSMITRITTDIWTHGRGFHLALASGMAIIGLLIWGRLYCL